MSSQMEKNEILWLEMVAVDNDIAKTARLEWEKVATAQSLSSPHAPLIQQPRPSTDHCLCCAIQYL